MSAGLFVFGINIILQVIELALKRKRGVAGDICVLHETSALSGGEDWLGVCGEEGE